MPNHMATEIQYRDYTIARLDERGHVAGSSRFQATSLDEAFRLARDHWRNWTCTLRCEGSEPSHPRHARARAAALRATAERLEHGAEYNVSEMRRWSAEDIAANTRTINEARDLRARADELERVDRQPSETACPTCGQEFTGGMCPCGV